MKEVPSFEENVFDKPFLHHPIPKQLATLNFLPLNGGRLYGFIKPLNSQHVRLEESSIFGNLSGEIVNGQLTVPSCKSKMHKLFLAQYCLEYIRRNKHIGDKEVRKIIEDLTKGQDSPGFDTTQNFSFLDPFFGLKVIKNPLLNFLFSSSDSDAQAPLISMTFLSKVASFRASFQFYEENNNLTISVHAIRTEQPTDNTQSYRYKLATNIAKRFKTVLVNSYNVNPSFHTLVYFSSNVSNDSHFVIP
jgi:hypothetical protein